MDTGRSSNGDLRALVNWRLPHMITSCTDKMYTFCEYRDIVSHGLIVIGLADNAYPAVVTFRDLEEVHKECKGLSRLSKALRRFVRLCTEEQASVSYRRVGAASESPVVEA